MSKKEDGEVKLYTFKDSLGNEIRLRADLTMDDLMTMGYSLNVVSPGAAESKSHKPTPAEMQMRDAARELARRDYRCVVTRDILVTEVHGYPGNSSDAVLQTADPGEPFRVTVQTAGEVGMFSWNSEGPGKGYHDVCWDVTSEDPRLADMRSMWVDGPTYYLEDGVITPQGEIRLAPGVFEGWYTTPDGSDQHTLITDEGGWDRVSLGPVVVDEPSHPGMHPAEWQALVDLVDAALKADGKGSQTAGQPGPLEDLLERWRSDPPEAAPAYLFARKVPVVVRELRDRLVRELEAALKEHYEQRKV